MYLNCFFVFLFVLNVIQFWHSVLKSMYLGWNPWCTDVTRSFATDIVKLGRSPGLPGGRKGFFNLHLEDIIEAGSLSKLSRAPYGRDISYCFSLAKRSKKELNRWKRLSSISLSVSLHVRMVMHHKVRDRHKYPLKKKISFFHNLTMCPS